MLEQNPPDSFLPDPGDARDAVIATIPERCKRCYCCVRECPARAIQIIRGQAVVLDNRCIGCGNCIKVCSQNAKAVRDGIEATRVAIRANAGRRETIAVLAPSFPAAFPDHEPRRVIGALRELGFTRVLETAFGADLVSAAYQRFVAGTDHPIITSPCPAIVAYIEKYQPELIPSLAPIVSPMIALGRVARERYGGKSTIVFIGPCIAKKLEILDPEVRGIIDEAMTFDELEELFAREGINPAVCAEREFDQPRANLGQIYPISGGLLKSAEVSSDVMDREVIVVEGRQRCLNIINEIAQGKVNLRLIDILFCEGCINGPGMHSRLNFYEKRERIITFVGSCIDDLNKAIWRNSVQNYAHLDLSRDFHAKDTAMPRPPEDEILRILERMDKGRKTDQLNCGACGYETCRELATAVWQGLAEPEMCLPYTIDTLEKSHRELAAAQDQLVHSEKLASVGQLAAGVAHEINNPLGTILLYSQLLRKQMGRDNPAQADIQFIIDEAERCRNIVASLLNFARQGKLQIAEFSAGDLLNPIVAMLEHRDDFAAVRVTADIADGLPPLHLDGEQIKQVLLNIAINGCEAMLPAGGTLTLRAKPGAVADEIAIEVEDTGAGIPKENMARLFTPFFTTKQIGKGTGLGLPIAYGIVKMHHGRIEVRSEPGRGATFIVTLPVDVRDMPGQRMTPMDFAAALAASGPGA